MEDAIKRIERQLQFLVEVDKMKGILRQTVLIDQTRRENDAEHSWHFALMAMILFEYCEAEGADLSHVIKMALVHDLIEIYAGDTFAYDAIGIDSKAERERESADRLFSILPEDQGEEIRALWEEFEAMETPSSLYANAIDRFQPLLHNYMTHGYTWKLHQVRSDKVYKRMEPILRAAPELWEIVDGMIKDSIEKGNLVP